MIAGNVSGIFVLYKETFRNDIISDYKMIRKEVGVPFSRRNPLATWLATLTASFAGSMIANPLLG
jgi:hypothetical protein